MSQTKNLLNTTSLSAIYIEMLFNDVVLSSGTAFFAKMNGKSLLFTNRHNVTGKNNTTGECVSDTGGIPNKLRAVIPKPQITEDDSTILKANSWTEAIVNLYRDEYFEFPIWVEHPLRDKIDVVGIPHSFQEDAIQFLAFDITPGWYK